MNKFLKIFTPSFIVSCVIAFCICYYVIPIKTQMLIDKVIELANTKIFIIGGTTITLGLVIGVIIKLVYDRYRDSIKADLRDIKSYYDKSLKKEQEVVEKAEKTREEANVILYSYEERIDILESKIIKVCETVPNAKVQALVGEIKDESGKLREEMKDTLTQIDSNYVEYKTKISTLEEKVDKLLERLGHEDEWEKRINYQTTI